MSKADIKKMTDRELIVDYVKTYSKYDINFLMNRGVDKLRKHLKDLEAELLTRNILSEKEIKELNY